MKIEISYSKAARRFLKRNVKLITQIEVEEKLSEAIKAILKIEDTNIDLKRLKGKLKDFYRIRSGKIRIIFKIEFGVIHIVQVNNIDFRGEAYKK